MSDEAASTKPIRKVRRRLEVGDEAHGGRITYIDRAARRMGVKHDDGSISTHRWSLAKVKLYEAAP